MATATSFPLSAFDALFNDKNQGLKPIFCWDKIMVFFKILAFKRRAKRGQPDFFISRESWDYLRQGIAINMDGSENHWLKDNQEYKEYEVCGFVFCVAFHKYDKEENPSYWGYVSPKHEDSLAKRAYFRIRTILKNNNKEILVETENIAYANLTIALYNMSKSESNNCLTFITKLDTDNPSVKRLKENIDNVDVIIKDTTGSTARSNTSKFPSGFLDSSFSHNDNVRPIITNEGSTFGSKRIWEDLFAVRYEHIGGSLISFVWNGSDNTISFDFKINEELITTLPCPEPTICN